MTYQHRFEAVSSPAVETLDRGAEADHLTRKLSGFEEELALMDCAIPLTRIPELDDLDGDDDLTGLNLFSAVEGEAEAENANFLRATLRSRLAQGRVVALRRRHMRAQLRRAHVQWPLPGGQADNELRAMRDRIYAPDPEALAAEEKPSVPLRVATHAISLSLVATALPIGAAMLTYNLLKGEDLRATARLTTLTGLALAIIAGNPQLAQFIGV